MDFLNGMASLVVTCTWPCVKYGSQILTYGGIFGIFGITAKKGVKHIPTPWTTFVVLVSRFKFNTTMQQTLFSFHLLHTRFSNMQHTCFPRMLHSEFVQMLHGHVCEVLNPPLPHLQPTLVLLSMIRGNRTWSTVCTTVPWRRNWLSNGK